jgi:hypothetical protein
VSLFVSFLGGGRQTDNRADRANLVCPGGESTKARIKSGLISGHKRFGWYHKSKILLGVEKPMESACVAGFTPSQNGLPFPNSWPDGLPVFRVPTPFGRWNIGNAKAGVCGGMVYAVIDLFQFARPVPTKPTEEVFAYCARRLLESWDLPFGWGRYYDWQLRPDASAVVAGVRLRAGTTYLTAAEEWPRIKQELDAGRLAPLGLVNERSLSPLALGRNHQVLAYGYEATDQEVRLQIYDPN